MTGDQQHRVARLSVTPVKGLGVQHPDAIELTPAGAAGNRDFFMLDERDKLLSIPRVGAFARWRAEHDAASGRLTLIGPDGRRVEGEVRLGDATRTDFFGRPVDGHVVEGPWAGVLSELAGRPVRLIKTDAPGMGNDVAPVTLLGDASTAELARRSGLPAVDGRRFRMLIEFTSSVPHVEDSWEGAELAAGDALLRVGGPVPRCAATTRDPDTGDRDLPTLRLIREYRGVQADGAVFGVYATVVKPGTVRLGDPLVLR